MKKILKFTLIMLGIACIVMGVISAVFANINVANFILILMGAVLFSLPLLQKNKFTQIYRAVATVGFAVYFGIMLFIACSVPEAADNTEDAVIVLGCAVIGDRPSNTMVERVYTAYNYYQQNPEVMLVLSGGQGPQENLTEARAMEKLFLDLGVPQKNLILEEKATSTTENYIFSKELLDRHFDRPYKIAFVTNDFHCYRAGRLAKINGFDNVSCIAAKTPSSALALCYVREVLAVIKLWIFKC